MPKKYVKFVDRLYSVDSIQSVMPEEFESSDEGPYVLIHQLDGDQEVDLAHVLLGIVRRAENEAVEIVDEFIFEVRGSVESSGINTLLSFSDINVYRDGDDIVVLRGDVALDKTERYTLQPMDVVELMNSITDNEILRVLGIED